ncbi:AMP-binding protein, partial [Acinetobacter baumannii]
FAQGSTLVLCNNRDLLEVEKIIDHYQVDQITLPPSVLKQMSYDVIAKSCRWIVVAGEAIDLALVEEYKKHVVHIINAYGPTEGTVCATIGNI